MTGALAEVNPSRIHDLLRGPGLFLTTGPFSYRIRSSFREVADGIQRLYADAQFQPQRDYVDFDIRLDSPNRLRRWWRPKLEFYFDQQTPFKPLPLSQAYAFLEWGMNWCVSVHVNQYLKLHAAVLEKGGRALVMPGAPGAGKSTLCAALMFNGWRLLSDEHALIALDDCRLVPVCRPISLKNVSIEVIKEYAPNAVFGPVSEDTHKGRVVHLKPSAESFAKDQVRAVPGWVVFPQYQADSPLRLTERIRETAFLKTADQSFNYSLLGRRGFEVMGEFIGASACYNLTYSQLDDAVAALNQLSEA